MKKLLLLLTTLGLGALTASAQVSSSSQTTTSTKSSLSVSVSKSNSKYAFNAIYDKAKTDEVKKLIVDELGKPNEESTRSSLWEGKGYSIMLSQKSVAIDADRDKITKSFYLKIESLGEEISELLHNKDN